MGNQMAAGGQADKPRAEAAGEKDTYAKMLAQGVMRVVQSRQEAGQGPLLVSELEEEFEALLEVPFYLWQAGDCDAVAFLQK